MPDPTYIALIICLIATNFTRITAAFKWISDYLSSLSEEPDERLVPLYDLEGTHNREKGVQIGFVRITDTDDSLRALSVSARYSDRQDSPEMSMNQAETSQSSAVQTRSTKSKRLKVPSKSLPSSSWDGWPNTEYYTAFASQEIAVPRNLNLNWSCEKIPSKRGSPNAVSWQKGKEIRQRCIGVLECGVESATYFYSGGARFMNFGTHTHSKYTHTLSYRKHQPLEFEKFISKYDQQRITATRVESSSGSDSEDQRATVVAIRDQPSRSSSLPAIPSENEVDDGCRVRVEYAALYMTPSLVFEIHSVTSLLEILLCVTLLADNDKTMDTFRRFKKWVSGLGKMRRKKKHRNGFPVYDLDELSGYAAPILDEEGQIRGFETEREIIWGRRRQAEYPTPPLHRPTRAPLRTHPYRRPEPVVRVTSPATRRTSPPAPVQGPSKRPNRAASPQGNATSTRRPSARKNAPAIPATLPAPPASTLDDEWDGWPNGDFCLFAFVEHYRKLEEAAAHGTKIYYGKDPQQWKRTKARLGYTKPSRHNAARRRITKSDSRPPDTSKALLSKRHVRTQKNTEYEKSYKWKDNSCWLDCALTLISTAAARDYAQSMAPMFESLPPNSPLRDLHQMVHTRTQGSIQLLGYDNGGSDLLNNQRDGFRRQIRKTKGHTDLGLRSFSSVWGWLYAICGHYRRSGVAVDPVIERAASYFRATVVSLRTCTENSSGFDHWQVSHVRPRSEFQLSRTICEKYSGNMRKWFQDVVRVTKSIPQSACWQVDDGRVLCLHGNVKMQDILLNIPVVLIIEMGDTTECEWDIPATIAPYVGNAAASTAGLKYSIVGHVYGGEVYSHFTARYVSTSGAKRRIFDYNDMKHDGHAIQRSTKSFAGSLTGPSRSIKMADNYQLYGLVYHLDGGEGAQKFFRKQQVENAQKLGLKFHFDPSNDNGIPSRCELNHPHAERMEDDSAWIKKSALKNLEYVSNFPRSPKKKATAWRLPMAPRVSSSSSDSEDDAPPNTPPAPPIFPLPSPIEPDNDDVNIQSSSQITGSTTVCPVWCAGTSCEAFFPEGDNEYEEVQCSDCKWWSHIRCLPKGINWHDPAVEFICRRCQFFELEELVLFPPPGTSNLDEGTVRWYPARFLSRDRQQQGTDLEFEFIWLDCVENAVGAGQTFSVSREFCKEVYHICEEPGKIKKSQLPKVRMPRYLDPNFAGHNNPQLEAIFESAIPSIVDILTDFSDLHPLVRHYINFEKEAKKPKKRPKRGVHTTPTESSIAFDWQETIGLRSTPEQNVVKALAIAKLLKRVTYDALDPDDKSSPAEWKIRVSSVGSALLQILVVQHELGEPLNLNGDLLEDLLSRKIIASTFDGVPVLRLIMTCAMGQITNATTSVEKFAKFEREFTIYDENYRPPTFRRVEDSTTKPTPPITVTVKRAAEDEIEDKPSPKRVKKGEDSERPKPRRRARAKKSG
ncbi:hypothetical protein R3P38DRAFT_2764006 [Favolaschia claudopus]|uniref:Zinc finger PHD-type domain-containing protein n=1 Tax=Favolaschia claudopus TaxID=2862362 RepID=A0AAW0DH69_9AGAR